MKDCAAQLTGTLCESGCCQSDMPTLRQILEQDGAKVGWNVQEAAKEWEWHKAAPHSETLVESIQDLDLTAAFRVLDQRLLCYATFYGLLLR